MDIFAIYELVDYLKYLFEEMGIKVDFRTPIDEKGLKDILMIYNNKEFILDEYGNIFLNTIDK